MSAPTKSRTSVWSSTTLTAAAGNTNGAWIDLSTALGAVYHVSITNGATGPTLAAQVQLQTANDYNSGSPTLPINDGGALTAVTTNAGVSTFTLRVDPEAAAARLVAGSNTGQNVTISADVSVITGIS